MNHNINTSNEDNELSAKEKSKIRIIVADRRRKCITTSIVSVAVIVVCLLTISNIDGQIHSSESPTGTAMAYWPNLIILQLIAAIAVIVIFVCVTKLISLHILLKSVNSK
ncbi:hypothetical protein COV88_01250 [Candidatus Saccharibacteria bacterium CG11_big_fil_rev_8_21_14_0_20_41_19]|nr:MAG: hypothetical protein AUK57_00895 [Candidatus Saccharibacteria bacterium CG2_30_41_52]PIQ71096.1 MAG: hypothetical protein COV88_01250 [Candidatus Saccharibacteria bacterium CG11_big_fil_rev_8_21_14_0_20_41_19]PIZ59913.1 MAG: hypothetical protein COY18_02010 [Candidatus Saccharibacteria bacterium CG_4_10_14_0_2_um_filter_41_11]